MGWTDDPTQVKMGDARFCKKPTDMTYAGSHVTRDLMLGKIIHVRKVTLIEEV
jgi:uncharacterized protein (DUF39 family)